MTHRTHMVLAKSIRIAKEGPADFYLHALVDNVWHRFNAGFSNLRAASDYVEERSFNGIMLTHRYRWRILENSNG